MRWRSRTSTSEPEARRGNPSRGPARRTPAPGRPPRPNAGAPSSSEGMTGRTVDGDVGGPRPGPASSERRSSSSVKGRGASGAGPATDRRGDCSLELVVRATFSVPVDGQEGRTAFGLRVDIPSPPAGRRAEEIPRLPGPPRRHGTRRRDGAGHAAARPDLPVRGSESGRTTSNRGVCSKRWDGASQIARLAGEWPARPPLHGPEELTS